MAGLLVINAYGLLNKQSSPAAAAAPIGAQADDGTKVAQAGAPTGADPRVQKLEQRLAQLEAKGKPKTDDRPREQLSHAEITRLEVAAWNQRLAAHDAEPLDPKWAAVVAPAFDADFVKLSSENGFGVGKADCRSHSCTVAIDWPSFSDADQGYDKLLSYNFGVNCERRITLPEPAEQAPGAPAQSYSARIIFDKCLDASATVASLDHSTH